MTTDSNLKNSPAKYPTSLEFSGIEKVRSEKIWELIQNLTALEWERKTDLGTSEFKYVSTTESRDDSALAVNILTSRAQSPEKAQKLQTQQMRQRNKNYSCALQTYPDSARDDSSYQPWLLSPDHHIGNLRNARYVLLLLNPGLGEDDCEATSEKVFRAYPELRQCVGDSILQKDGCVHPYLYFLGENFLRIARGEEEYSFVYHGGFNYYAKCLLLYEKPSILVTFFTEFSQVIKEKLATLDIRRETLSAEEIQNHISQVKAYYNRSSHEVSPVSCTIVGVLLKEFSRHVAVIQNFPYHSCEVGDINWVDIHLFIAYLEIFYIMQRTWECRLDPLPHDPTKAPTLYCVRHVSSAKQYLDPSFQIDKPLICHTHDEEVALAYRTSLGVLAGVDSPKDFARFLDEDDTQKALEAFIVQVKTILVQRIRNNETPTPLYQCFDPRGKSWTMEAIEKWTKRALQRLFDS